MLRSKFDMMQPPLLSKQRGCVAAWHAGHLPGPHLTSDGKLRDFISNTHHAQFGSTTGSDSNDPLGLGQNEPRAYLYGSGADGNGASVPDAANLRITGDLTLVAGVVPTSKATGADQYLINKNAFSSNRSYYAFVTSDGHVTMSWSEDGSASTLKSKKSTAVLPDAAVQVKIELDVDNGASGNTVSFFYRTTTSGAWTALGTPVVTASVTSIFSSTQAVFIGAANTSLTSALAGKWYSAAIYAGLESGGSATKVLDIDFTRADLYNATRTSLTARSGQTVTINRSTAGRKASVVDRPLYLLGTDDYFEVPDHADLNFGLTDFSLVIACRVFNWSPGSSEPLITKNDPLATTPGYGITNTSAGAFARGWLADGSVIDTEDSPAGTTGQPTVLVKVTRRGDQQSVLYANGIAGSTNNISAVGNISNTVPLRIGKQNSSAFGNFEFLGAALFNRALNNSEIRELNRIFLGVPL